MSTESGFDIKELHAKTAQELLEEYHHLTELLYALQATNDNEYIKYDRKKQAVEAILRQKGHRFIEPKVA